MFSPPECGHVDSQPGDTSASAGAPKQIRMKLVAKDAAQRTRHTEAVGGPSRRIVEAADPSLRMLRMSRLNRAVHREQKGEQHHLPERSSHGFCLRALRHRLPRAEIDQVWLARRAVLPEHRAHHRIVEQLRSGARVQEWHLRPLPLTANFEPALHAPLPIPAGGGTREGKPDFCSVWRSSAPANRSHERAVWLRRDRFSLHRCTRALRGTIGSREKTLRRRRPTFRHQSPRAAVRPAPPTPPVVSRTRSCRACRPPLPQAPRAPQASAEDSAARR